MCHVCDRNSINRCSLVPASCQSLILALCCSLAATATKADDKPPVAQAPQVVEFADEPKLIDPATVMPAKLAASATVDLSELSLREVIEWLRNEQQLVVLTEANAFELTKAISSRADLIFERDRIFGNG